MQQAGKQSSWVTIDDPRILVVAVFLEFSFFSSHNSFGEVDEVTMSLNPPGSKNHISATLSSNSNTKEANAAGG